MKFLKRGGFFLMFLALVCALDSEAAGSTQFWPAAGFIWDINGPWILQYKETYYYFKGDSDSDHPKGDVTVIYEGVGDLFDLGLGLEYLNGSEETKQERRPYALATIRKKLFDMDVSNRFRVEYRDITDKSDFWRFRNKLTWNSIFEYLYGRDSKTIDIDRFRPYLADEIFVSANGQGFTENRAYAGMVIKLTKHAGVDIYYFWQRLESSSGEWNNNNVIGTDFILKF